jgi:serine/threonine protein kinase
VSDPPSQKAAPVKPGDVLAEKYEVERVLGVGGMGVVVAAHHLHLKQRVALKFLLPELATNTNVVARFVREAQSASTIRSEHVVRVTDVGILSGGVPYLVMEHLEGRDLGQLLVEQGRLPIAEAVDYVLQAMVALAEAHNAGIVHRDLKPSNLFLTDRADGSPLIKVLDFGISKITKIDGDASSKSLTSPSGLMGSPLYMSPEQIRSSKNVDARADIWSLGVILYELLTGTSPFWGEEVNAILAAIVADDPVPLAEARGDVPRELEAVVMKCLAKRPEARYPGVGALARALAPFGSPAAALSVERVLGVTSRSSPYSSPDATLASPLVTAAATAGAWTHRATELAAPKSKRLVFAGVAVAVVAAVAGAVLVSRKSGPAEAGSAAVEAPPPVAPPPPAPAKPSTAPAAAPEPVRAEPSVASIPIETLPIASSPAPKRAPSSPTPRRPATKKPAPPPAPAATPVTKPEKKPSTNVDDMIDERR